MTTTVNVDKLVVYKYNYDKKNKQIVCAKCYAEKVGSGNLYTVQEAAGRKHLTEIKKEDIDDISKSFGTPLYLTEKKDELAIKHFRWACEMKIQEAKEEMNRYIEIKRGITDVNGIQVNTMGCNYKIYNNETEEWYAVSFSNLEAAEIHIMRELDSDFDKYSIYEKICQ